MVQKENEMSLQWAAVRTITWICGIQITDRFTCNRLGKRLGTDDIITVLQQNRLRWYGHVSRKDENDCVKKCINYKMEGVKHRGITTTTTTVLSKPFVRDYLGELV